MSGKRDSNPRPLAWKANALSTELLPLVIQIPNLKNSLSKFVIFFLSWGEQDSNLRRHEPADLQSAPVGHFGISPIIF